MSVLATRLPKDLRNEVSNILADLKHIWLLVLSIISFLDYKDICCQIVVIFVYLHFSWIWNIRSMKLLVRWTWTSLPSYWREFLRSYSHVNLWLPHCCSESIVCYNFRVRFLQSHLFSCTEKEKTTQERLVEPLMSLVKSYEGGRESHARVIVRSLFEEYLSVEELFSDSIQVTILSIWLVLYDIYCSWNQREC